MKNFTFLTDDQIFGTSKLEIFDKIGTQAAITDFAILLGGYVSDNYYYNGGTSLEDRTGWYWTSSDDKDNDARVVGRNGGSYSNSVTRRDGGARPAFSFSSISSISTNGVSGRNKYGIIEFEYGEYPQKVAPKNLQVVLEQAYHNSFSTLKPTGKTYTTDSKKYNDYEAKFQAQQFQEYSYTDGKKYVRVKTNSWFDGSKFKLSNGEEYKDGDYVWVEVQPIKWLVVDENKNIALSERLLFAGVQFKNKRNYKGDFSKTDIKKFMDDCFSKDIELINVNVKTADSNDQMRKSRIQKLNPDTTDSTLRRRMTDTEIIQSWIESGQSVLLRGPSGIGKTERIKTLYPDLIYIKLTNNMFPEKVVGSMNLQTGQSIPPNFAKQALMSCATDEERKLIKENIQNLYDLADTIYERSKNSSEKVVIMLDELLNVKPTVQSLVYTLVLNKLVETGKGLKLPANTVIVATGNQKKYSSVAEDLAEPLEKRFDHILDMEPKVGEWINEYAIPNKIHPSVIGYILSKYINNGRSDAISDINYFYEEPEVGEKHLDKNGCNGRTNDPRGWVSISNTLYSFEADLTAGKFVGKDVESLLQTSIGTKLREEWASEFFNFYNLPTLSPKDIVEHNYSQSDLPRDINERFACVTSLLLASSSQVSACREFIRQYCDPEYLSIYDICWVSNDEKRMELINELQELSTLNNNMTIESEGVGKTK